MSCRKSAAVIALWDLSKGKKGHIMQKVLLAT